MSKLILALYDLSSVVFTIASDIFNVFAGMIPVWSSSRGETISIILWKEMCKKNEYRWVFDSSCSFPPIK